MGAGLTSLSKKEIDLSSHVKMAKSKGRNGRLQQAIAAFVGKDFCITSHFQLMTGTNINLSNHVITFQRLLERFPWEHCWCGPLQHYLVLQTALMIVITSIQLMREAGLPPLPHLDVWWVALPLDSLWIFLGGSGQSQGWQSPS